MVAHVLPQKLAGRYDVKDVLGQGGMGLVYRAYDTVIRRDVALKTLRDAPDPSFSPALLQRIRRAGFDEPSQHRRDFRHRRV